MFLSLSLLLPPLLPSLLYLPSSLSKINKLKSEREREPRTRTWQNVLICTFIWQFLKLVYFALQRRLRFLPLRRGTQLTSSALIFSSVGWGGLNSVHLVFSSSPHFERFKFILAEGERWKPSWD